METTKKVNSPLVSIIIPVHNPGLFLRDCLDSVTQQTYKNIEIIAVNDDSTDGSKGIIREYQKADKRLKYFETTQHNAALARREGTQEASGEYICFVDSDDVIHPDYVNKLLGATTEKGTDIATAKIAMFHDDKDIKWGRVRGVEALEVVDDLAEYFFNHYVWDVKGDHIAQSINAKIFHRSLLARVDYSMLKTTVLEDNYIVPQILHNSAQRRIALVEDVLYLYRFNPRSTMSNALTSTIKYDDNEITYPQLFEITLDYIKHLFSNENKDVDSLANKLRAEVYYGFTDSLLAAVTRLERQIEVMASAETSMVKEIEISRKDLTNLVNSRAYKIGRLLTLPIRFMRLLLRSGVSRRR